MEFTISDKDVISKLEMIQRSINITENALNNVYMCDCMGCSNECFECCSDGMGYSN